MTINEKRKRFSETYGRSPQERSLCRNYVDGWWKEEARHRLRIADEVTGQVFLFDLPWDMEPTSEPVAFEGEINWMYQPGDDPEFIYQMNRHQYWICLGQAYAMTGKEAYAECFAAQLLHWIRHNPITEETKPRTWRTIEAGLRGINWIRAMGYFIDSPAVTDEVFVSFLDAMAEHGAWLAACDVPFSVKSNWGVLENNGLYAIGWMLDLVGGYPDAKGWTQLAKRRLTRQIQVQVMDDGVHWEMSPMYHNEVLRCYLEALQTAKLFRDDFPDIVKQKVRDMAMADLIWQKPDGTQPAGGDSDVTDLRDILTACAYWFEDPVLKSGGFPHMDYEGIWNYGAAAAEAYERLPGKAPEALHHWMKDSGNWYLRSSWGTDGDYFHLRCGSLGGGHGHFDKCHMDLMVGGEDILVDTGRYTYVDGPDRRAFKSTAAHNSVTVDGLEYTRCLDSWGVTGLAPAVKGMMSHREDYTLMECGHLGYIQQGVYIERRVLAIGTRIYLVMDTCYGHGEHVLSQYFHPAPEQKATVTDNGFLLEGRQSRTAFSCTAEDVEVAIEEGQVSRHYNQKEPGRTVVCRKRGSGVFGMTTVIVCETPGRNGAGFAPEAIRVSSVPVTTGTTGQELAPCEADGTVVQVGDHIWKVINAHAEAGAHCEYIGIGGSCGLGRVMIAREGEEDMTVLRW